MRLAADWERPCVPGPNPESHGKPPKDVFVSDDGTVFPVGDQTVVARMAW